MKRVRVDLAIVSFLFQNARRIGKVAAIAAFAMFSVTTSLSAHAQAQSQARPSQGGAKRQLATILYSGLGGAALGLSTLSFYGRPQDKLVNIAIGFAVGVIAGTTYVTYNAATNPASFYGDASGPTRYQQLGVESQNQRGALLSLHQVPLAASYRFEF